MLSSRPFGHPSPLLAKSMPAMGSITAAAKTADTWKLLTRQHRNKIEAGKNKQLGGSPAVEPPQVGGAEKIKRVAQQMGAYVPAGESEARRDGHISDSNSNSNSRTHAGQQGDNQSPALDCGSSGDSVEALRSPTSGTLPLALLDWPALTTKFQATDKITGAPKHFVKSDNIDIYESSFICPRQDHQLNGVIFRVPLSFSNSTHTHKRTKRQDPAKVTAKALGKNIAGPYAAATIRGTVHRTVH